MAREINFVGIARDLLGSSDAVCQYLLPGGRRAGREYLGPGGRSLSINLKTGVWKDFADDAIGGGDLINLWAHVRTCSNGEAAARADAWIRTGREQDFEAPAAPRAADRPPTGALDFSPAASEEPLPAEVEDGWWRALPAAKVWDYRTIDGELWAQVYRWHHPTVPKVKAVRPWNPKKEAWQIPPSPNGEGRPLLYLAEIMDRPRDKVVLVAGEKACDAVRAAGHLATTTMGGESAISLTEWSPLAGRHVIIWRDKDTAGRRYATRVTDALREAGVAMAHVVEMPPEAPPKSDAADIDSDQIRAAIEAAVKRRAVIAGRPRLSLIEWGSERYAGEGPPRSYLVQGSVPLGCVSLVAGEGGIGKGLIGLDLAHKVAYGDRAGLDFDPRAARLKWALGGQILRHGRAVVLAGEDTADELHARLAAMDVEGLRERWPGRLFLVPLPNAGGNYPLIRAKSGGVELTEELDRLRDELAEIEDLRLVIIDPLARFAAAKIEQDVDAGQMLMGALGAIAADLNISILIMHHMVKARGKADLKIKCPDTAREAIRGSTGIVDGARMVYAFWPETDWRSAEGVISSCGMTAPPGDGWRKSVVYGAVVKHNGPADQTVRTFVRTPAGTLIDQTPNAKTDPVEDVQKERAEPATPLELLMAAAIRAASELCAPFKSRNDMLKRRQHLPAELAALARRPREEILEGCLEKRLVVTTPRGWLDVPNGRYAMGDLSQAEGAVDPETIRKAGQTP